VNLSVTEDPKGKSGLINVDISDVCYIQFDGFKRILEVHTIDKKYYMPGSLTFWIESLGNSKDVFFRSVDRNSLLNMERIARLDRITKVAYFDTEITGNSKYCPIAWHKFEQISELIKGSNPSIVLT